MDLRDLLSSLGRIDAASFAASGTVLLSNLAIVLICGWALYHTGERAFAWLLLAAVGGNVMILADFLLAPQVTAWAPASAQGWRIFRFVAYAFLAGFRAWGLWLLARRFGQFVRERRAAGQADE